MHRNGDVRAERDEAGEAGVDAGGGILHGQRAAGEFAGQRGECGRGGAQHRCDVRGLDVGEFGAQALERDDVGADIEGAVGDRGGDAEASQRRGGGGDRGGAVGHRQGMGVQAEMRAERREGGGLRAGDDLVVVQLVGGRLAAPVMRRGGDQVGRRIDHGQAVGERDAGGVAAGDQVAIAVGHHQLVAAQEGQFAGPGQQRQGIGLRGVDRAAIADGRGGGDMGDGRFVGGDGGGAVHHGEREAAAARNSESC